jgi:hypothetical protein
MSNYKTHAMNEFRIAGWIDDNGNYTDEMQGWVCDHLLKLLDAFAEEGHSGSYAPYTIKLFKRLAMFETITPLTGADDEWHKITDGGVSYQNKRNSAVFKQSDRFDGQAYWLNGKVFWEWYSAPDINDGKPYKSYYTSSESQVPITFPWTQPEKPEYVFVPSMVITDEVLDEEL